MARILTPEQFRQCPKGTLFTYGEKWALRESFLILDSIVQPSNGHWGFYAENPMFAEALNFHHAVRLFENSLATGEPFMAERSSTKYMDYMDGPFEVFLVLDRSDWDWLCGRVAFPAETALVSPDAA